MPTMELLLAQSIHTEVHRCSEVHAVVRLAMAATILVYTARVDLVVVAVDAEQEVYYVINIFFTVTI